MATRTISNSGGNYSATGTWVEGVVPTASDAVVATGTSGDLTVDATGNVAASVDFTNYPVTSTVTFAATNTLTVYGVYKQIAGMNITGTGSLVMALASTMTSAGVTFPGSLVFAANATFTLADNWTLTGLLTYNANMVVLNGNQITCNGGITNNGTPSGTTNIILAGGTWSGSGTNGLYNNLTIAGNVTVSGAVYYRNGVLTYLSGTVTWSSAVLRITANCTLNTSGITWPNVTTALGATWTLQSDLNCTILNLGHTIITAGNFNINCASYFAIAAGASLTVKAGQTLNISTTMFSGTPSSAGTYVNCPLKSGTASSPMYLNYQGPQANLALIGCAITDVDASSSAIPLFQYQGSTLLRTVNITNIVLPPAGGLMGSSSLLGGLDG